MPAHRISIANRRARTQAENVADELRERRLSLGLSQAVVAGASGMSRNHYASIEAGTDPDVTLSELNRIAAVLGLDLSVRVYPGGRGVRDAGQAERLIEFLRQCRSPLTWRIEVPLPALAERWERRAWDAVLHGHGERTAVELEMRLRDVQATRRRHELKRRDDPTEHFLLLIADTRHNRGVVAELGELFADLPRLRPSEVRRAMELGQHPGTGLLFL